MEGAGGLFFHGFEGEVEEGGAAGEEVGGRAPLQEWKWFGEAVQMESRYEQDLRWPSRWSSRWCLPEGLRHGLSSEPRRDPCATQTSSVRIMQDEVLAQFYPSRPETATYCDAER